MNIERFFKMFDLAGFGAGVDLRAIFEIIYDFTYDQVLKKGFNTSNLALVNGSTGQEAPGCAPLQATFLEIITF